jgi:hypothetical protein
MLAAMGVAIILYGKIYTTAAGRAIRTADKLRMMLAGNAFSDTLILLYVMFSFLAVGLIGTLHSSAHLQKIEVRLQIPAAAKNTVLCRLASRCLSQRVSVSDSSTLAMSSTGGA